MEGWKRIKQLLSEPTYRTRLAVFVLIGIVFTLLATMIPNPFWSGLLLEFAVVFDAVALIQFLWDFLGGDPMEIQIRDLRREITHMGEFVDSRLPNTLSDLGEGLTSLKHSMNLLADLIDGNIGIERIWPDRRSWQHDPREGLEEWERRICRARHVDIMSRTLVQYWLRTEDLRRSFFDNIAGGASVRILVYDPNSEIVKLTARDEADPGMGKEMRQEIESTLGRLAEDRDDLNESAKSNLQLRLTTDYMHLAQIIRADSLMLVGLYLSGKSGTPSPTIQLRGPQSTYFEKYVEQFEIMWARGNPVDDATFDGFLKEYSGVHPPPPED